MIFVRQHDVEWEKCVGVCTDGARAMTGKNSGVVSQIQKVAPQAKFVQCSLHRKALVAKKCPDAMKTVLTEAVKAVNFIKSKAANSRLFSILCGEMGSDHKHLLFHTEVRWLSKGNCLARLFQLKQDVQVFLLDSKSECSNRFTDCHVSIVL